MDINAAQTSKQLMMQKRGEVIDGTSKDLWIYAVIGRILSRAKFKSVD